MYAMGMARARFISDGAREASTVTNEMVANEPDITLEYIQRIDNAVCPVKLMVLTHSTCAASDWSVDRINSDGAYTDANLIVISSKDNRIKGRRTYEDVAALARGAHPYSGLTQIEWAGLSCLKFGAHHLGDASADRSPGPLLTHVPPRCRAPPYFHFQQVLLDGVRNAELRNRLLRALNARHPDFNQRRRLVIASERLSLLVQGGSICVSGARKPARAKLTRRLVSFTTAGLSASGFAFGADPHDANSGRPKTIESL